jgi:hypothetical protein
MISPAPQLVLYIQKVLRFFFRRGRDTYQLGAGLDATDGLLHGGQRIHGVGRGHRLYPYRMKITQQQIADLYFQGLQASVSGKGVTV